VLSDKTNFFVMAVILLLVTSCGDGSDNGGDAASACSFSLHANEPDLSAAPYFSANTVSVGNSVDLFVPVDAQTAYIGIWMISSIQRNDLVITKVVEEAIVPGEQTLRYQIVTNATDYPPGAYFADIELCDNSNSCSGANVGTGVAYSYSVYNPDLNNYWREVFYKNGPVREGSSACFKMTYLTVI